jgi:soluble lytic murein transglycosylase-like protein
MDNLCLIVVLTIYPDLNTSQIKEFRSAQRVCEQVSTAAYKAGVDEPLALAVAVEETRLQHLAHKKSGARGPMQVLPKYWCPAQGKCDYVEAGVDALKYYLDDSPSERRALQRYAGAGKRARNYAERVLRRVKALRALLLAVEGC